MSIQQQIESKLNASFNPDYLEVINESGNHNVPPGSESHFKVVMVASAFDGLNRVKRHQAVYGVLGDELSGGVHALALHLYTADEWQESGEAPKSPRCLGGGKT